VLITSLSNSLERGVNPNNVQELSASQNAVRLHYSDQSVSGTQNVAVYSENRTMQTDTIQVA
jgi:hypothetical protein